MLGGPAALKRDGAMVRFRRDSAMTQIDKNKFTVIELGLTLKRASRRQWDESHYTKAVEGLESLGLRSLLLYLEKERPNLTQQLAEKLLSDLRDLFDSVDAAESLSALNFGVSLSSPPWPPHASYPNETSGTAAYALVSHGRSLGLPEEFLNSYVSGQSPGPASISALRPFVTVSGSSSYIFISYAKEDSATAFFLHERLRASGFDTWIDEVELLPGQDWDLEIRKAVKAASITLVLLSERSISKRGYVQKEIRLALDVLDHIPEGEIFLIPVLIERCRIPDRLASRQAVNINAPDGYRKLCKAIILQLEGFGETA